MIILLLLKSTSLLMMRRGYDGADEFSDQVTAETRTHLSVVPRKIDVESFLVSGFDPVSFPNGDELYLSSSSQVIYLSHHHSTDIS